MNKMEILNPFLEKPVATFYYEGDVDKIKEFTDTLSYQINGSNNKTTDTWVLENEELKELKEFCLKCIQEYMEAIVETTHPMTIQQSWVNANKPGQNHGMHFHSNSYLSGVFYIAANQENGSPIVFHSQRETTVILPNKTATDAGLGCTNPYMRNSMALASVPGSLVLFPSHLVHSVPENQTDETRISLSFNTFPQLPIGSDDRLNSVKYVS